MTDTSDHRHVRAAIVAPSVWRGDEIQDDPSWVVHVQPEMIAELDAALASAEASGLTMPFDASDMPLDRCLAIVDDVVRILAEGPGLALVRGLPRHRWTDQQCELVYWCFGVHLGNPISQNSLGHRLGHVRDIGLSMADPNVRSYQTNARLDFHADQLPVDVLGLFCLRAARSGGASKLVSATAVHNVVREERPDLLDVLYQPFNLDWRDEQPPGEQPWYAQPMFSLADGMMASRFTSIAYFESVDRHGEHLAQRPEQTEALHFVQEVANRPGMAVSMMFQEGDMQFLNNHAMLHARDAFEDHEQVELRRHLLRMWIAYPPELRQPLSPQLAHRRRYVEMGGIPASKQALG